MQKVLNEERMQQVRADAASEKLKASNNSVRSFPDDNDDDVDADEEN